MPASKAEVAEVTERAMRGELDFEAALDARVALLKGLDARLIDRCPERAGPPHAGRTLVRTMAAKALIACSSRAGSAASPQRRRGAVPRAEDDQPPLRRRPTRRSAARRWATRLPGGRRARPAHRLRRGPPHRPGQVRQGVARRLHRRRAGGQGVPAGAFGRRRRAADEARGPAASSTYRGDDWERYKNAYAPKRDATPDEAKRLIEFARLVTRPTTRRSARRSARTWTWTRSCASWPPPRFVVNPDSFFSLGHNYYLYLHPKTRQVPLLPVGPGPGVRQLPALRLDRAADGPEPDAPYAGRTG